MEIASSHGGHSARVIMRLLVNGSDLAVKQMGPDFVLLASPCDHPPCDANLVLQVDDSERRWRVRLPEGISANCKRVAIA